LSFSDVLETLEGHET